MGGKTVRPSDLRDAANVLDELRSFFHQMEQEMNRTSKLLRTAAKKLDVALGPNFPSAREAQSSDSVSLVSDGEHLNVVSKA
jgi:hypothetical protein